MIQYVIRSGALVLGLHLAAGGASLAWSATTIQEQVGLAFDRTHIHGGVGTIAAPVHLPPAARIVGARLVLGYANALAVEPEGSRLRLAINGTELADLPLVAAQGALTAEIEVPPGTLHAGANLVTLTGQQRHRLECTRAAFGELWTRIEPATSYLEIRYSRPRDMPVLRDLDGLLASSLYDGESLAIVTGRPPDDPQALEWGGLAAEAVALRRGERPLAVERVALDQWRGGRQGWQSLVGRNHVAIGTLDELGALLPPQLPAGADHGLIAIRPLPGDPDHLAIVVSGATEAAVTRAAERLRRPGSALPASPTLALAPGLPGVEPTPAASGALGPGTVSLAELGYRTEDLPVGYTETIELPFRLPDDYYAGDGQRIELALDFAYGAGLGPTSALVVRVNGAPWNMLRLDRGAGDMVEGATIELPMGLFRPGPNLLGFEPVLHLAATDDCAAYDDRPMFSLFDDSEITIPRFARLARQPDLALFAATAFPYGGTLDQVGLVVGGADPATVAAAWTLRAKLAQRHRAPLSGLSSGFGLGPSDRHLLVVAPTSALPPALADAVPIRLDGAPSPGAVARAAVARVGDPAGEGAAAHQPPPGETVRRREHWARRLMIGEREDEGLLSTMTGWIVRMARAIPVEPEVAQHSVEDLQALGEAATTGAVAAFRSPFATDRTVTVVTAADPAGLATAMTAMITPPIWDRLTGDVALFDPDSGAVLSHGVASPYLIRAVDTSPGHLLLLWRTFMAKHQGAWLIAVLVAVALLSLVTGLTLRRMAR